MVKAAVWVRLFYALAWIGILSLPAKNFAAYQVGDIATEDITTPVTLNVIEPGTVVQQMAAAQRTPVVFRSCPGASAAVAGALAKAFDLAHSDFLAAIQNTYSQSALDGLTVTSADFEYLVTAYNLKHPNFPISTDLARHWACGDADLVARDAMIHLLLQTMRHTVRPDELPAGLVLGGTVRLVDAGGSGEELSLQDASQHGKLVPQTSIITLTALRNLFRQGFPLEDQLTARALARFLQPNCALDVRLTEQARAAAVGKPIVVARYDAGQVVVRRGQVIDATIKAALDKLSEKVTSNGLLPPVITASKISEPGPIPAQTRQPRLAQSGRQPVSYTSNAEMKVREDIAWMTVALSGVSVAALLLFWWQWRRRHAAVVVELPPHDSVAPPPGLGPHLTRVVKDALVRELAAQRGNLFQTQQAAAMEVARLTRQLEESQAPLADRLRSYKTRIEELEQELADRTRENRELLQSRIEMLRRQLSVERAAQPVEFN